MLSLRERLLLMEMRCFEGVLDADPAQAKVNSEFRQSALVSWHGQTSVETSEMVLKWQKRNKKPIHLGLIIPILNASAWVWSDSTPGTLQDFAHKKVDDIPGTKAPIQISMAVTRAVFAKACATETPKPPSFLTRQSHKYYFTQSSSLGSCMCSDSPTAELAERDTDDLIGYPQHRTKSWILLIHLFSWCQMSNGLDIVKKNHHRMIVVRDFLMPSRGRGR